jgi:hypothetical protein
MIRVSDRIYTGTGAEFPDHIVWEALRRGILEHVKVVCLRTTWDEFEALRAEMTTPPDQAALEGGDVPDDDAVK